MRLIYSNLSKKHGMVSRYRVTLDFDENLRVEKKIVDKFFLKESFFTKLLGRTYFPFYVKNQNWKLFYKTPGDPLIKRESTWA